MGMPVEFGEVCVCVCGDGRRDEITLISIKIMMDGQVFVLREVKDRRR